MHDGPHSEMTPQGDSGVHEHISTQGHYDIEMGPTTFYFLLFCYFPALAGYLPLSADEIIIAGRNMTAVHEHAHTAEASLPTKS